MRHDDSVNGALLTRDGTRIVSWSYDNTLRLWDVPSGNQIGPAMRHGRSAGSRAVWFTTPDNRHRVLGTSAGILSNKSNDDAIWGALLIQNDTRIISWGNDFADPICQRNKTIPPPDWSSIERATAN
jgi:WD40 repeat protein